MCVTMYFSLLQQGQLSYTANKLQRHKSQDKILDKKPMVQNILGTAKQINDKEKTCI